MNKDEQDCLMTDMPTNDTETSAGKTKLVILEKLYRKVSFVNVS